MSPRQHIKPRSTLGPKQVRSRRIGRKALQADRFSRALDRSNANIPMPWYVALFHSKQAVFIPTILFAVIVLGFFGSRIYLNNQAASQKAEAVVTQKRAQAKSLAADECRQKKVQEKADLIGKVTYDELYDGNECDK